MEEIIDKIENLKKVIDREYGNEIRKINREIKEDKTLLALLDEYSRNPNDKTKNEIINNKLFQKYKEQETDINIVILAINNRLKELSNNKRCNL